MMNLERLSIAAIVMALAFASSIHAQEAPVDTQFRFTKVIAIPKDGKVTKDGPSALTRPYTIHLVNNEAATEEQIKKILQTYGLKGDKLEHAMIQIKKQLTSNKTQPEYRLRTNNKNGKTQTEIKTEINTVEVGPDGKRREINQVKTTVTPNPQNANKNPLTIREYALDARGFEKLETQLKSRGLTKEQIERISKAYQQATKEVGSPFERVLIRRLTQSPSSVKPSTRWAAFASQFVIGVDCDAASEVVRSQLAIGTSGLVVKTVADGTPAKKTGIKKFDVITAANETELRSVKDLVSAIQTAGKEKKPIVLSVFRAGKKLMTIVTPIQRKAFASETPKVLTVRESKVEPKLETRLVPVKPSQMQIYRPRIDSDLRGMKKQIEQLQEQVKELQKQMNGPRLDPRSVKDPRKLR
jgi:hypothetical protein